MNIIFIDIDGVLNSYQTIDRNFDYPELDPRNLTVLKEIVEKTNAKLVLTSSWKDDWWNGNTESKAQSLIRFQLKQFDMDVYDCTKDEIYNRGEGIRKWISSHKIDKWIVLDDEMFPDFEKYGIMEHFIKTDPRYGLTMKDIEKIII